MLSCRFYVAICCACAAYGTPTLNVIAEGPAASADATGQELRAAAAQAASFAANVRAATRRMSVETQRILAAQVAAPPASDTDSSASVAGFFSSRDAGSELERLSSMFHTVAGDAAGTHARLPPIDGSEAPTTTESSVRKLLLDAGNKFAEASGELGMHSASFLQPVDANLLRKSLRATEPMRSPSPMTVNVITAEDVPTLRREAKYKGLAAETIALHNNFEDDVAALAGDDALASSDAAAPSFVGVDAIAGAEVITLRPSVETIADIEGGVAALKDARSSKHAALTTAYNADWQRMLDGEKVAIGKLLRSELLMSTGGHRSL